VHFRYCAAMSKPVKDATPAAEAGVNLPFEEALKRLNEEPCTCGCGLTVAQCRINDPSCGISLPIAKKIVEEAVRQ